MKYLLGAASRPVLSRLAKNRTLCAFDFDGTLAPITEHPGKASMREQTRRLLARLAELYPCVILSGRAREDVLNKLDGVAVSAVFGNHGAEAPGTQSGALHCVREWKAVLSGRLRDLPGVWIEDKGLSLAVHYRQSPHKAKTQKLVLAAAQYLPQSRIYGGKQVMNVVLADAPHKGEALEAERKRLGCDWVVYAGDDENDEDAFAMGGNLVAVLVGKSSAKSSASHAGYYLRTQAEIDDFMEELIALRVSAGSLVPQDSGPNSDEPDTTGAPRP